MLLYPERTSFIFFLEHDDEDAEFTLVFFFIQEFQLCVRKIC